MELVRQREKSDCVIACLAMLTSRDYDDVKSAVGDLYTPDVGVRPEYEALKRLGFVEEMDLPKIEGDFKCYHCPYPISAIFFRQLLWGRKCLLSVPSLNIEGQWHMVYYDGRTVFDPSPKKTYEKFEELKPRMATIFAAAA